VELAVADWGPVDDRNEISIRCGSGALAKRERKGPVLPRRNASHKRSFSSGGLRVNVRFSPIAVIGLLRQGAPVASLIGTRKEQAGKCPDSFSGRHFWLDVTRGTDRPAKRYSCRNCRKEVIDEPSSFLASSD
jgi:hypothetical protein